MEILALTILIIFCLVGFVAIFFTTFGTLIILIGSLLYALITSFSIIDIKALVFIFILYLLGEASEYLFVIWGAKRLGASNVAIIGALIGAILGALVGVSFLGIGLIPGTFLGIFLGAFLAELIVKKDLGKSIKSGAGGVIGRISSIAVKVAIAFVVFSIMFFKIINFYRQP